MSASPPSAKRNVVVEIPEKAARLFEHIPVKSLRGGRGSGKSFSVARALIVQAMSEKMRILCAREFQTTIAESVHQLIKEQIVELGFAPSFQITENAIRCTLTGSEFLFIGLRRNVNNIRSIQNIKRVWVEEAQTVSKMSWETLIPSVMRVDGAEIWLTWNPELETDETYIRFVVDAVNDPDIWDCEMNWRDNRYFPDGLERERVKLKAKDPDAYLTVWEGQTRAALSGAIFAKEMRRIREEKRRCRVVPAPGMPVDAYCDLGKRDLTAIWFVQRHALQTRVVGFYQNRGEDWPHYLTYINTHFREKEWSLGTLWLPHDGFAERLGMLKSIAGQSRDAGFTVREVPNLPVETGISLGRTAMAEAYFDEVETQDGWNSLARYRYKVDDTKRDPGTQWSSTPLHDDFSNAGDAWRYVAVALKEPKKEVVRKPVPKLGHTRATSWMGA